MNKSILYEIQLKKSVRKCSSWSMLIIIATFHLFSCLIKWTIPILYGKRELGMRRKMIILCICPQGKLLKVIVKHLLDFTI